MDEDARAEILAASRKPLRLWNPWRRRCRCWSAQAAKSLGVTSADRAAHVLRALGMCAYFGLDHVGGRRGGRRRHESKTLGEYAQKVSYWGWFVGSEWVVFKHGRAERVGRDAGEKGFARPEGGDADADAEETNERSASDDAGERRFDSGEKSFRRSDHEQRADGVGDGALRTGEDVRAKSARWACFSAAHGVHSTARDSTGQGEDGVSEFRDGARDVSTVRAPSGRARVAARGR